MIKLNVHALSATLAGLGVDGVPFDVLTRAVDDGCKDKAGATPVLPRTTVPRNNKCPCGSDKKFKQCCMGK